MPNKLEGEEQSKRLSEAEVARAQNLIRKVQEVIGWDLGAFCSTSEELEIVDKAKAAMKEVQALFHVPEQKFWVDFPGQDMAESVGQADEHNTRALPGESLVLSPVDLEKLHRDLDTIGEVVGWDIGKDETDINILHEAQQSLEDLKNIS